MNLRLVAHAALYAAHYAGAGILLTILPAHLEHLGLESTEVGVVMSISALMVIFGPLSWGYVADRLQRGALVLRFVTICAWVFSTRIVAARDFAQGCFAMFGFAVFSTPVAAMNDAATLSEVARSGSDYARVRLWGSLGFVGGAVTAGLVGEPALQGIVVTSGIAVLSTFGIRGHASLERPKPFDFLLLLKNRTLFLLLASE